MKIGLAQINSTVGDFEGNTVKILGAYRELKDLGADVVLTPELVISGYPPQDLLFKSGFVAGNLKALGVIKKEITSVPLVVGYVDFNHGPGRPFRNAAAILRAGHSDQRYFKHLLPTYDVFDEARYFEPGKEVETLEVCGIKCGITICEDIWSKDFLPREMYSQSPVDDLISRGCEIIFNISASPFEIGKPRRRFEMLSSRAQSENLTIAYCNAVGGNDELVFDGNSMIVDGRRKCFVKLGAFAETNAVKNVLLEGGCKQEEPQSAFQQESEELFGALVLGVRDYLGKCGFKSVVIGLSGGIDSAVTAAIAVEALGAENVLGVTMPSRYSSEGSVSDSQKLSDNLGINCLQIPIEPVFNIFKKEMLPVLGDTPGGITEENMQPRIRGMTLMAISNRFGHMLLTTGNKSELAVGYCTLYGDMCGGLAVISDVPKTMIYRLAKWLNSDFAPRSGKKEIIPENTILKPPSAELKPDQRDQDTLPPYEILDPILDLLIEDGLSVKEISEKGYALETAKWVAARVALNEYKRAQAVPGLKVTRKAFGVGRKMPVAQKYKD